MPKLNARIIRPAGIEHELASDMIVLPGFEGELGVMYNHVPMVVRLKDGDVKVHNDNNVKTIQIQKGIAIISNISVDVIIQ